MNDALKAMLSRYRCANQREEEAAIREILQEIALAGLSRAGFFQKAAFYGGTCLRIFHGLNRYSEDLDFALLRKDPAFDLSSFLPSLRKEFLSCGIDVTIEQKEKSAASKVQSAFIKGNTLMLLLSFFPGAEVAGTIPNQKVKIKFEIDTDNPEGGKTLKVYRMLPSPYEVRVYDEETLFAGKIHAILCRERKANPKGRDFYDYLFYIGKGTKVNLVYLRNKLVASGKWDASAPLTSMDLKAMLEKRFIAADFRLAAQDVRPFLKGEAGLEAWSKELFLSTLPLLQEE